MLRHIVQGYLRQAPTAGGPSAGNSRALPPGTRSSISEGDSSRQIRPPKRPRENTDSEGDENNLHPSKRLNGSTRSLEKPRFLACSFWKFDPDKHWECFLKKLTTVSRVKQHLKRRHTPTFYCQRCFLIFSEKDPYNDHVFGEPCEPRSQASLEGISTEQRDAVCKKSKGTTVEEQWYGIWDILFPGESRPLSIYVDTDQSQDFLRLREFSQTQGISIFFERIRDSGMVLRPDVSEQGVREIFRRAMHLMFEGFLRREHPAPAEASPQTESLVLNDSGPQRFMTDDDSGVMLASHSSHGSNADHLAITEISENNNGGTPAIEAIESVVQPQADPVDSLQVPEAFNTDVPEDWGILGETESVLTEANFDDLFSGIFDPGDAADGGWRQP